VHDLVELSAFFSFPSGAVRLLSPFLRANLIWLPRCVQRLDCFPYYYFVRAGLFSPPNLTLGGLLFLRSSFIASRRSEGFLRGPKERRQIRKPSRQALLQPVRITCVKVARKAGRLSFGVVSFLHRIRYRQMILFRAL